MLLKMRMKTLEQILLIKLKLLNLKKDEQIVIKSVPDNPQKIE